MQHISLVDLKVFCAVADEGNLTRGSARVHLSPSTVSERIKNLESELGVALFSRNAQGMKTTAAGEVVRQGAHRIDREIHAMLQRLEPFASREAGTLRIVSNYGATMNFLAAGLAQFLLEHPEVTVSHHRCSSQEVVEAVAEDRADIGVGGYVGDYPGLEFIDYEEDDVVLVVNVNHPFARRECIDFTECLNQTFVYLSDRVEMQNFVDDRARELGYKIVPRVRVSNQPLLFQMVAAGVGVGIASRVAFEARPDPNVRYVKINAPWSKRNIRIAIPKQPERRTRWVQEFVEVLKKTRKDHPTDAAV